jgi:hypothetical protein
MINQLDKLNCTRIIVRKAQYALVIYAVQKETKQAIKYLLFFHQGYLTSKKKRKRTRENE